MSFNYKRMTWLACKNIVLMTAAIFLVSAAIVGAVYVLATVFGPAGMTIVLPLAVLVLIAIAIAYKQVKNEEVEKPQTERKKAAEKLLATSTSSVNNIIKPQSKTASK